MSKKKTNLSILLLSAFAMTLIFFMGCQEEFNDVIVEENISKSGKLTIRLTDAPFPAELVEEANVTINKIEIRNSNNEDDGYPFITLSEEEMTFNLLDLTNGVTAILADTILEEGSYDLIRLFVADASIMLTDSTEYPLSIPSGAQSGIKVFLNPPVVLDSLEDTDILLDFDVSKSFIVQGNPKTPEDIKGFKFKPVIKAFDTSVAGTLTGTVTDTEDAALKTAEVSVWAADTVYSIAYTDSLGSYTFPAIDEGTYEVGFSLAGYQDTTVTKVKIKQAKTTTLDVKLSKQ